jgi:hypothetical protein
MVKKLILVFCAFTLLFLIGGCGKECHDHCVDTSILR